ncbi:uncharacterized protein V6R79_010855 [Siganus canaliculatus]
MTASHRSKAIDHTENQKQQQREGERSGSQKEFHSVIPIIFTHMQILRDETTAHGENRQRTVAVLKVRLNWRVVTVALLPALLKISSCIKLSVALALPLETYVPLYPVSLQIFTGTQAFKMLLDISEIVVELPQAVTSSLKVKRTLRGTREKNGVYVFSSRHSQQKEAFRASHHFALLTHISCTAEFRWRDKAAGSSGESEISKGHTFTVTCWRLIIYVLPAPSSATFSPSMMLTATAEAQNSDVLRG